jgi:hypothetical protein
VTIKTESQLGAEAYKAGQQLDANPFPRNSEESGAWQDGWRNEYGKANPRVASRQEVEEATRLTDVGQFRSRHRYPR